MTLVEALRTARWGAYSSELELQDGVHAALHRADFYFDREHRLDRASRIDFLAAETPGFASFSGPRVGIECKISGGVATVAAQLERYTTFDVVSSVLLVTTRASHRELETTFNGKRVAVAVVGRFV